MDNNHVRVLESEILDKQNHWPDQNRSLACVSLKHCSGYIDLMVCSHLSNFIMHLSLVCPFHSGSLTTDGENRILHCRWRGRDPKQQTKTTGSHTTDEDDSIPRHRWGGQDPSIQTKSGSHTTNEKDRILHYRCGGKISHRWGGQDPSLLMERTRPLTAEGEDRIPHNRWKGQDPSLRMGRTGSPTTDREEMITHYRWRGQDPSLQVGRTGSLTTD